MSDTFSHGHALIIGVGGELPNTVQDATGLAEVLRDPERCAYPPEQVKLLTSEQATRQSILEALDSLSKITDPQATVIVYFSGYGYRVKDRTRETYYLMPYGYNLRRLHISAIKGQEFIARLHAIPTLKMLVLLDCCHANGLANSESSKLKLVNASLPPEAVQKLIKKHGRVLIASSQDDEVPFRGKPYSAFTLSLIEALCGKGVHNKDGFVRVGDLTFYTCEMVVHWTRNYQHPSLAFLHTDNYLLSYYAGGETQPKELPFTTEPEIEYRPDRPGVSCTFRLSGNGTTPAPPPEKPGKKEKK